MGNMKIAIVGCGLNSDYHIRFARDYPDIEIIAVVDRDEKIAADCASRQGIKAHFTSIAALVKFQKPDVLHIITPPKTHFALAKEAINLGCNLLIEKPMVLNRSEAVKLYDLAESKGVKLCTMHNHFFDPCMMKARKIIASGAAGRIIGVESFYGLNTRIDAFRKYPRPNVLPWLYSMPGGVYHDFMPHVLYVAMPFVGKCQDIDVSEKTFGELPQNISDELRITVKGDKGFATLTFSTVAKPFQHFIKYYGTKMMIKVNIDTMTTTCRPVSSLPKAAQKATLNLSEGWQLFKSTVANVYNFGTGKLRPYQGMKTLMHAYYDSIRDGKEPPVSREEAISVIEAMDSIWKQVKNRTLNFDPIIVKDDFDKPGKRVLVTGATGLLGKSLVEALSGKGYKVRALARKLSRTDSIKEHCSEILFGDVGDMESLEAACKDIDIIIHAAADTGGDKDEGERSTVQGTKNVVELCKSLKIKKLIYISSCGVYGPAHYKEGSVVTEETELERTPELRGAYSDTKQRAEAIVTEAIESGGLSAVCLRPGTFFGPGSDFYTPMMGMSAGQKAFFIIGDGEFTLPLISIDNLVDAIIKSVETKAATGGIYNLVDSDSVTKKEYVEALLKKLYPDAKYFYIPYKLFYGIVFFQEMLMKVVGRRPFLTRYRTVSSQRNIKYSSEKIRKELGWKPPQTLQETIEKVIDYERNKS